PQQANCTPNEVRQLPLPYLSLLYAFTFTFSRDLFRDALMLRATASPAFRARQSWYATSMGAATAIDEYVPIRIPITNASENPRNTSPPNRYNDSTVRKVSPDVRMVRLSVWLMLLLTMSASGSRRKSLMFSRMRSNTTMVSFIE